MAPYFRIAFTEFAVTESGSVPVNYSGTPGQNVDTAKTSVDQAILSAVAFGVGGSLRRRRIGRLIAFVIELSSQEKDYLLNFIAHKNAA